jgi:hypothetical protein
MNFKQYDAVKLMRINVQIPDEDVESNLRPPKIGDIAYIIEVYVNPPGYELECSDEHGITQWLMSFGPDDVEMELAK